MSKCIVTGCAGFIGYHLTRRLLADGHDVVGVDNLSTGKVENVQDLQAWLKNHKSDDSQQPGRFVFQLMAVEGFRPGHFRDRTTFKDADVIFHQAALGSVPRSIADPVHSFENNVRSMLAIIESARGYVSHFVYASSSSVYGYTGSDPIRLDEFRPLNPLSPYAASKVACEALGESYAAAFGMHTVGLRYFNVYGPRQRPDGDYAAVVPRFIHALLVDKPIEIHGSGRQTRAFTFIDDVVEANLAAWKSDPTKTSGIVCNVAYNKSRSVLDIAHVLRTIFGRQPPPDFDFKLTRSGDVTHSSADLRFCQAMLNVRCQTSLEDGLNLTVKRSL